MKFQFIGRCDSCGAALYDYNVCYDATIGHMDVMLCSQCCKKHAASAGLNEFSTEDLVDELRHREGVDSRWVEPYMNHALMVDGPAWVLTVVD